MRTVLSFFFLQHLFTTSSRFNRRIEVQQLLGRKSLMVNGIMQTGPYIEGMFNKALHFFGMDHMVQVNTVLILGVGGGHIIKKIRTMYPHVVITAVDIDETIIAVGKRYFDLPQDSQIKYIIADAKHYVARRQRRSKFDFIFVDLFIGNNAPPFIASRVFYLNLQRLLHLHGKIMLNYHGTIAFRNQREKLELLLSSLFTERHTIIGGNEIFFLQSSSS